MGCWADTAPRPISTRDTGMFPLEAHVYLSPDDHRCRTP